MLLQCGCKRILAYVKQPMHNKVKPDTIDGKSHMDYLKLKMEGCELKSNNMGSKYRLRPKLKLQPVVNDVKDEMENMRKQEKCYIGRSEVIDTKPFVCKKCQSRYADVEGLLSHVKMHRKATENMDFEFGDESDATSDGDEDKDIQCIDLKCGNESDTTSDGDEDKDIQCVDLKCHICSFEAETMRKIAGHLLDEHDKELCFICKNCSKGFCDVEQLGSHVGSQCGGFKFSVDEIGVKQCHLCGLRLDDAVGMSLHLKFDHGVRRNYRCRFCKVTMVSEVPLLIHGLWSETCYRGLMEN